MVMFKEWFFFPRGDRRAIVLLSILLTIMMCLLWWRGERALQTEVPLSVEDSLAIASFEKEASKSGGMSVSRRDSVKYSDKGSSIKERQVREKTFSSKSQTKNVTWVEKFQTDTVIDLNVADTLLLKRVPGIGSWRAHRIVEFRGHLGGYSRVGQLLEIDGMPDSVLHWFAIHTPPQKVLNLNDATVDEMASHPYLTYKQARVILRHKRLHGPLNSLDQLSLYEEFTQEQLERLVPYVAF